MAIEEGESVLDHNQILSILGWGDGVKIPSANEENRRLESELANLLKKKTGTMISLCKMKEQVEFNNKSLLMYNQLRDCNQEYLNRLSKQLEKEMSQMKDSEVEQGRRTQDTKSLKQGIKQMEENIQKLKEGIKNKTEKMLALKESLAWGEDALFDWEESVARGQREIQILEKYKNLNEEKFSALDQERKQAEEGLREAMELEKREDERFKILALQLENINKLIKEVTKDNERLMKVWSDAMNACHQREKENKRLTAILGEVNDEARQKCTELYEDQKFYDDLKGTNEGIENETSKIKGEFLKVKEEIIDEEVALKHFQSEAEVKRKATGNMSGAIELERMRNTELNNKISARRTQYEKMSAEVDYLQGECVAAEINAQANDTTYKKAGDIIEMKQKQLDEDLREYERLQRISKELEYEILKIKEKIKKNNKEYTLAEDMVAKLQEECLQKEEEIRSLELAILSVVEEEHALSKKVIELKNKCSGKSENEMFEKEIKELEEEEAVVNREHLQVRKRLECLQREYKEKLRMLKSAEEELEKLSEAHKRRERIYENRRREIEALQGEQHKHSAQLKLHKMKEHCLRESIVEGDTAVGLLQCKKDILEMVMKDRILEIEAQRDVLLGKRRSLVEEKIMRLRQIEHINTQIELIQSRYATTLSLMGKDESGEQLSVAYFKIKLAQEKYELQLEQEELEAKMAKAESEIEAMERTLHWVKVNNENFKFALESVDMNDKMKIEKEKAETKLHNVKKEIEEESDFLKTLKAELEELLEELTQLKEQEQDMLADLDIKRIELCKIEREKHKKEEQLKQATLLLRRALRDAAKAKEPPKYKKLAQKEINLKIEEERNHNALKILAKLSSYSDKLRDMLVEKSLDLEPESPSSSLAREAPISSSRAKSRASTSGSSTASSRVSIINLSPAALFPQPTYPPCRNK